MSGIINLQRDSVFLDTEKTELAFATQTAFSESVALKANVDATVYDSHSFCRSSRTVGVTITAGQVEAIGLLLKPPGEYLSPYRVKAYAGTSDAAVTYRLIVGYAEGTITGSDDLITHYQTLNFIDKFDELLMIAPQTTTGTSPIFFGILLKGDVSNAVVDVHLSVQRLATSPPPFSHSVS